MKKKTLYLVNSRDANKTNHENSSDLKIFGSDEYQSINRFDFSNLWTWLLYIPIKKIQLYYLNFPQSRSQNSKLPTPNPKFAVINHKIFRI